jgi:hypothetical protein
LKRLVKQHIVYKDPISKKKVELLFSTVYDGDDIGCPLIEVNGRIVMFELKDLAYEAILVFRREGILPTLTPEQIKAEKERADKGLTGFSPVKPENERRD